MIFKVPAQVLVDVDERAHVFTNTYTELLYAHLLDADGSRLTYTHFTSRVAYGSLIDISFNRPVYIQKHKVGINNDTDTAKNRNNNQFVGVQSWSCVK